ncbi:MAG: TatD family hydrolase [Candidatus Moranbacteria bacterium]|nr:TatD family hydrolase [Candidatus Moranbacteria bacterium]MDD3964498.1 TatD family hydrolase [Candidatus Moranbacteria bacterium]
MIDIHTHLYWESYDADRDEVIARAHDAGVEKMFVIGCTLEESRQCVTLSEKYGEIFASVGIHPNELSQVLQGKTLESLKEELRIIAKHKKVIAIGECGLDYYKHGSREEITEEEKSLQKEGFVMQMALAEELGLPLIIHCRSSAGSSPVCNDSQAKRSDSGGDAYEDMFDILKNHTSIITHQLSCILHCYMGDTLVTEKFLTLPHVSFSFTGNITYPVKKALIGTKPARYDSQAKRSDSGRDDLTETVKMIPIDRIFAETDCPFLAPQEKRGERNEPAYVMSVLEKIASLKNIDQSLLKQSIMKNIQQIFSI